MSLGELEIAEMTIRGQYAAFIAAAFCFVIFLGEFWKFLKYRTRGDALELSGIGTVFLFTLGATEDPLLSILFGIFIMMVLGTWEVRENAIWSRLMASFTLTYGFVLAAYLVGIVVDDERVFGIGWNLSLWVLLITSFLFFGRRFILVSRFLSPTYVYLFLYGIAYLALLQANLNWELRYPLLFLINLLLYVISGPLLRILFGIESLEDERISQIVNQVKKDIKTPIRQVGVVKAPILNAFAYGPWFDQRIAFIASDLSKYSDEEIAGIAAHELAHLKGKHTLILLFFGFVDLGFRFITNIPASYYDYAFKEQTLGFLQYYIINFVLGIVALFFVRILEGNADRRASEAGYGLPLAASLYRLEGYYRGIAGELGLSSQLLTGKERTAFEEKRFMGDTALDLQHVLLAAPRIRLLVNLIMSHPLSAFRIAAILNPKITPVKGALLPWILLVPKLRGRWLRTLRSTEREFADLLTRKYLKDYGAISEYSCLTPDFQWYSWWEKQIICFRPRFSRSEFTCGLLEEVISGRYITEPINLKIRLKNGEVLVVPISSIEIHFADIGADYILKNGRRANLKQVLVGKKGKPRFCYQTSNRTLNKNYLGIRIEDLPKAGDVALLHTHGTTELITVQEANFQDSFKKSYFRVTKAAEGELDLHGKDIILSKPANYVLVSGRKHWDRQRGVFEWASHQNVPLTLFDKNDLEIGHHCTIRGVTDEIVEFQLLGDENSLTIHRKRIDAVIPRVPIFLFYIRQELGLGTRIGMRLANRGQWLQFIL